MTLNAVIKETPSDSHSDAARAESELVRDRYDWTSTPPSTAVVESVAAATDQDPMTIAPLYSQVDPDALDALFTQGAPGPPARDLAVTFGYADREVTVTGQGSVTVTPRQDFG